MKYLLVLVLCIISFNVDAQQSVVSSFGEMKNNIIISYSVGQVFYNEYENSELRIREGVQQTFYVTQSQAEFGFEVNITPNPANDHFVINIPQYRNDDISYFIINVLGQTIKTSPIVSKKTYIDINKLARGDYIIYLINNKTKNKKALHAIKI